ncbi:restriction endonuclease subunit S [Idiomarina baltica]|uniref:restriction endonuclease subunit S n=1 Tax=Idiomarina baltica TaxID=190892 RepID=UPI002353EFE1|nr:restriction endonuclease subunit S [Idiomarina baltica]
MVPEGWITRDLGELITYKKGFAFTSADYSDSGVRIIRISDTTRDSVNSENPVYIPNEVATKLDAHLLSTGDILLTTVGSRPHLIDSMVGKVIRVPPAVSGSLLNQNLVKLIPIEGQVTTEYLFEILRKPKFRHYISTLVRGNANQVSISLSDLFKYKALIPNVREQKKIAQILSTWDKAITTTEQLLANSQQQKKALMQQLLTGKKRFNFPPGSYNFITTRYGYIPEDWNYPEIKDICSQITEKNTFNSDYPVLSCSKYEGFVDSLKYFKKKVYSSDTSGYRVIRRGDFGFPANHIEEGSIGLQKDYDSGLVSPIYVVFRASRDKVVNEYLYAVLKTDHYKQIFSAATNASVDRRGSLRWKEFSKIRVPLPSLKEQQEIATILSSAEQEIVNLKNKLDALKSEKKALMQQLLTGKRRVKVDEEAA